jgi:hypothetical protein
VTASVVPKNWLDVAKKMLMRISRETWSRASRKQIASSARATFV